MDAEEFHAAQNDPLLGQTVAGRFHVLARVGVGGMGTVYRAEQAGLDRPVALKVLKKELISDRDTVARFHREAKAMSMLMHPNTVRVFDFGEDDDGHLFLAMELLEGELLTAWSEREGTPPVDEAVEVVREILRSLAEAHSKGIIHRDLKPDNIFLARVEGHTDPVVKVLDFGIAKVFRDEMKIDQLETQAGTVFGTPRYMSPEQAQGKALDHRSDLYSVGVLLYQLLTGRPPFVDDDAVVVMAKHIREAPEAPRKIAADRPIPRRLEKVLMKALGKEPEDRFADADAFEAALAGCLPEVEREAERLASGRTSGFVQTVGSLPRVPLAIGGALVAAALILAGTVVVTSGPDEVAEARDVATLPDDSTDPSPAAASPPAPADEVAEPATTDVELRSEPPGATILEGDDEVGRTPHRFALGADEARQLTLRLEGHEEAEIELTAEAAPARRVELAEARDDRPARPVAARPTRPRSPSRERPDERPAEPGPAGPEGGGDPYERFD
ncbi:MAG TPA: serine/threonine-protein kinase [Sandaracinaceae bacterium LLY-WYZ-13_1]|nr:serine/threonine-protein kinase [Sandaracinaceae bacterium LLY-WYZ-13_1]